MRSRSSASVASRFVLAACVSESGAEFGEIEHRGSAVGRHLAEPQQRAVECAGARSGDGGLEFFTRSPAPGLPFEESQFGPIQIEQLDGILDDHLALAAQLFRVFDRRHVDVRQKEAQGFDVGRGGGVCQESRGTVRGEDNGRGLDSSMGNLPPPCPGDEIGMLG